jgi:hypothetical protein
VGVEWEDSLQRMRKEEVDGKLMYWLVTGFEELGNNYDRP